MSDISQGGAPATEAAPAAPTTTAPVVTPTTTTEVDPFDNAEVQQFDRTYVQKLREEAAARRTALKQYEVFEQYPEQDRQAWAQLATLFRTDPKAAAAEFARVAQALQGVDHQVEQTREMPKDGGQAQYLTQEQLNAVLAERDRQAAVEAETGRILGKASQLGYQPDTPEHHELLWRAANQHGGDLDAAHAAIQASRQAIIDSFLQTKGQQGGARVVTGGGEQAGESKPIQTFEDARRSVEARLQAQLANR